jgi:membrane-associated phospholipid phosphatase
MLGLGAEGSEVAYALAAVLGTTLLLLAMRRRGMRSSASMRLVLRILGVLGALAVFSSIAEEMAEGDATSFDRVTLLAIHRLDGPFMDVTMRAFTMVGSAPVVIPLTTALIVWVYRQGARRLASILGLVAFATELLNLALKTIFQRERPSLFQEVATLHSYSFPSGHTMAATAIYGFSAYVIARMRPRLRGVLATIVPLGVALIGVSRVFLGVHWPTDVIAGFAAGIFIFLGGALAARWNDDADVRGPRGSLL